MSESVDEKIGNTHSLISTSTHLLIVNGTLVEKLLGLVEKLKETKGVKIFKRGFKKAVKLLEKSEENGVFTWAPQLKHWLRDPDYIFWLGTVRWG